MCESKIKISTVEFPSDEENIEKVEELEQTVATTYNSQIALEWCAVLASQYIDFKLDKADDEWIFKTLPEFTDRAKDNINKYESERVFFEKHLKELNASLPEIKPIRFANFIPFIMCALFLITIFIISGPSKNNTGILIQNGVQQPELIFNNSQWWRSITALTLHADLHHVLSNCLFLVIFMAVAAESLGFGLAVFCVLLSGIAGNFSTAYILVSSNIPPYHSLGASTAVFGALGVITVLSFLAKNKTKTLKKYLPLVAGFAILSMTGASPGADVFAHFTGFLWGCIFAVCAFYLKKYNKHSIFQLACYFLSVFIVFISWFYALHG